MMINWETVGIYVKPGSTDMRKQINSLSVYVADEMKADPLGGDLFVFSNRQRTVMKILYWDRNGFCMWQKRLEKDRFPWPQDEEDARKINREELRMILDGIDFFNAHKTLIFSAVS